MKTAPLHAGRILAAMLLCFALADGVFAAPCLPIALLDAAPRTLTPAALVAAENTQTPGQLSPDGKTLTFGQKTVRIVVVTGPENDMLSYRIGGFRNPTLAFIKGATVRMLFVNTDDDMPHNLRFGPMPKACPKAMANYLQVSVGTPELSPKSGALLHGEQLTFHMPDAPGVYAYLCTVRGHAQGGMVGKVIVR